MRKLGSLLAAVLVVTLTGIRVESAPAPRGVDPCHRLCPEAADPNSYDTPFKRQFRVLIQGHDGWLFRSAKDLIHEFGRDDMSDFRRLVRAFNSRGTELVMAFLPTRGLIHPDQIADGGSYDVQESRRAYAAALVRFRDAGALVPDLTQLYAGNGIESFFFRRDNHWSPVGARAVAAQVAAVIRGHAGTTLTETLFETRRSGLLSSPGSLARAAAEVCGIQYPMEYVRAYETVPVEKATDAAGLFGDMPEPEVVLVGTSFSKGANDYNFHGFLQEYLAADVLNAAVTGGSYAGALDGYLNDPDYAQSEPARFVIWELSGYLQFSNLAFYRQMVPAAYGGCLGAPVLEEDAVIAGDLVELLSNARDGRIVALRSDSHIVEIQFEHMEIRDFELVIWYVDGRSRSVRIERDPRVPNFGRYVLELPRGEDMGGRTLLSVELREIRGEFSRPVLGSRVSTRLCRHPEKQNVTVSGP